MLKKYTFFIFISSILTISFLLFTTCAVPGSTSSGEGGGSSGSTSFWARRADGTNLFYTVSATLLYSGSKCLIYVDNNSISLISTLLAAQIANEFDNNIYQKIKDNFGDESDFDGNGKIKILILDIIDGFSGFGGYVAGYFDPVHLYSKDGISVSNEADMIFMDSYPGVPGSSTFYETIAHEFQHLINYYRNVFVEPEGNVQDTWINEGLSSAAETIYKGDIVTEKVTYYNSDAAVKNGTYFVKWTNELANYATVYLFFQWLRIHASPNEKELFLQINNDTNNDHNAVVNAANTYVYGGASYDWKYIFKDWLIANFCSDSLGIYGYNDEIKTIPQNYTTSGPKTLNPGDAVYKYIDGSFSASPSKNIDYIGITKPSSIDDDSSGGYTGDWLISYNCNPDDEGSGESTASLPSTYTILGSVKINTSFSSSNKKIYPIDFVFDPKKWGKK